VEKLPELADGPIGCGKVGKSGCSLAWNFQFVKVNCTHGRGEKDCRCISNSLLAYRLKILPAKNRSRNYTNLVFAWRV